MFYHFVPGGSFLSPGSGTFYIGRGLVTGRLHAVLVNISFLDDQINRSKREQPDIFLPARRWGYAQGSWMGSQGQ